MIKGRGNKIESELSTKEKIRGCVQRVQWILPVAGLVSLIWFLIRVVPKPSRATYPCQRVAAPLASGFVIWIMGLFGAGVSFRKARSLFRHSHRSLGIICLCLGICIGVAGLTLNPGSTMFARTSTDRANAPLGTAKGIWPGRVVWVRDANAVSWDGYTGNWYDEARGNQSVISNMMSKSVQWLTGEKTDEAAWSAIFRYYNRTHGKGDVGYKKGQTIAIKPNLMSCITYDHSDDTYNSVDNDAHLMYAIIDQLVNKAKVPANKISLYTSTSLLSSDQYDQVVADYLYNKIRSNPSFAGVKYYDTLGLNGRIKAGVSTHVIKWSVPEAASFETDHIANVPADSTYLINFAVLKSHCIAGVTLCGKNHGGSYCRAYNASISPGHNFLDLHQYMNTGLSGGDYSGRYRPFVDFMGHKDLGGKTILYLIDGLWSGNLPRGWNGRPERWNTCGINNDWPKSLFSSLDPVAIDSVAYDFCHQQFTITRMFAHADDYLHEAALANQPPSGTFYAPNNDGIRLQSLGTHEHWNNPLAKKYSRNISPKKGKGIELISAQPKI